VFCPWVVFPAILGSAWKRNGGLRTMGTMGPMLTLNRPIQCVYTWLCARRGRFKSPAIR